MHARSGPSRPHRSSRRAARAAVPASFAALLALALGAACSSPSSPAPGGAAPVPAPSTNSDAGGGATATPPASPGAPVVAAGDTLRTTDAGGPATSTVRSSAPPAAAVVPVTSSDPTEVQVDPTALTFSPDDWATPKTVTLVGRDDDAADGDRTVAVQLGPAQSTDGRFHGARTEALSATNADDDTAGVDVSAPSNGGKTNEAGGAVTFTVRLRSRPTADVTLAVTSSAVTEGTTDVASLVFSPTDWSTPKTVTVTGKDDAVADGDRAYEVTLAKPVSADATYAALAATKVALLNEDDDAPGLLVSAPSPAHTTEAGGTASFTVRLRSQPTADGAVTVASNAPGEGVPSVAALVFTAATYATPQTVTVAGVDDDVDDDDRSYVVAVGPLESADALYAAVPKTDVALVNRDDDVGVLGPTPGPGATTTEAGGQVTFTVRLASRPTAAVTVPVASSRAAEGTTDVASLVFEPEAWSTPRTITVTGADDAVDDGDQAYAIVLGTATSADAKYAGVNPTDVALTNVDDEPTCGDGLLEGSETCDDGNLRSCDGCETCSPRRWLSLPAGASLTLASVENQIPRGDATFEAWVRTTTTMATGGEAYYLSAAAANDDAAFFIRCFPGNPAPTVQYVMWTPAGARIYVSAARPCNDGAWHHVAATRATLGGGLVRLVLFWDGVLVGQSQGSESAIGSNAPLVLGGTMAHKGGLLGNIDEVRISARPLRSELRPNVDFWLINRRSSCSTSTGTCATTRQGGHHLGALAGPASFATDTDTRTLSASGRPGSLESILSIFVLGHGVQMKKAAPHSPNRQGQRNLHRLDGSSED